MTKYSLPGASKISRNTSVSEDLTTMRPWEFLYDIFLFANNACRIILVSAFRLETCLSVPENKTGLIRFLGDYALKHYTCFTLGDNDQIQLAGCFQNPRHID
jgi:hypothetical protein